MVIEDDSSVEVVPNAGPKGKQAKRLDLALWQMAWDRFALAAAMLEMVPYSAAMRHKQVVLEIAVSAATDERKPVLAVVYDELVRKEWENKSGLLGDAFAVATAMVSEDDVVLKRAKRCECTVLCMHAEARHICALPGTRRPGGRMTHGQAMEGGCKVGKDRATRASPVRPTRLANEASVYLLYN